MKLQLGSGTVFLDGFENTDIPAVDITKPLPYADESADIIVASHVLELIILRDVAFAMREIRRVLKKDGWVRLHFGSERFGIDGEYLAHAIASLGGGGWRPCVVDKEMTRTGDESVLKAMGQHGPAIVIELQKI